MQQTHCSRGHEFTPENTRLRGTRRRECKQCERDRQMLRGPAMTPDVMAKVKIAMQRKIPLARFLHGYDFDRSVRNPKLVLCDPGTFYRQRRLDPDFDAIVQAYLVGHASRRGSKAAEVMGRKRYGMVRASLPDRLPPRIKDEIVNMIFSAVGRRYRKEKCFTLSKLEANIKHFVADYNRMNPLKSYGRIDDPWSLDAPIGYDTDLRLIDTVTAGLW
jgi:hypothetical protein